MKTVDFVKLFSIFVVIAITLTLLQLWFQIYIVGNYYINGQLFFVMLLGSAPLVILFFSYKLILLIKSL